MMTLRSLCVSLLLLVVALCLFSPSFCAPSSKAATTSLSSNSTDEEGSLTSPPFYTPPPTRDASTDPQHDEEERIENSGEDEARAMQQSYQDDASQQQKEAAKPPSHHHKGSASSLVDRNATAISGDDLRHSRDPKQQQKQQREVRQHGEPPQPKTEQTRQRRDDEEDKAQQAESAGDANQPADPEHQSAVLVQGEESNNGTVRGSRRPYGHSTAGSHASAYDETQQGEEDEEGEEGDEEEVETDKEGGNGAFHPLHNATESRINQTSPWHNTDPQSRTWSHQQQPRVAPGNSSANARSHGYAPGEYNASSPLSYPLPVPTVDPSRPHRPVGQSGRAAVKPAGGSGVGSGVGTGAAQVQDPGNAAEKRGVASLTQPREVRVAASMGWLGWLLLLSMVGGAMVAVVWWMRRQQARQSYEPVALKEQWDAYGDLVEDEDGEEQQGAHSVSMRVY